MLTRGALGGTASLALATLVLAMPLAAHADGAGAASTSAATPAISAELMTGLAQHATRFEEMKRRGAFTMTGRVVELDGDGHPSDTKEFQLRSTPTPAPMDRITKVIHYLENGKDKTVDAQKRAVERRAKRLADPDKQAEERRKDLKLPFSPNEQARYVFSLVERSPAQPSHVRIAFVPKIAAENAIKGSAWVDERDREVLSIGFSFSKNPLFVDHVDITIVFGLPTQLGRAPSELSFDGRGGFLFLRKHYRGTATVSQPAIAF